jgi:type II secretory pathway component GspD/PulD (secretin)
MSSRPLLLAALAAAVLPPALAQIHEPGNQAVTTDSSRIEPALVIGDDNPGGMSRDRETLSVDFPDEEIRTVLRNVADLFELNLVIPDTLQGRTSIKLRDVTWRQIFQVVLSPAGYTYVEEGNIINIVSQESLTMEPVMTDVFILNYARAEDLRGSVEPLVTQAAGGRIVVNTRSNALVITERPSRLTRIRPIIEQLDRPTAQVMIETKFVEVTDRDIKNIGVNWAALQGFNVGIRPAGTAGEWGGYTRSRGQERSDGGSLTGTNTSRDGSAINTTSGTNLGSASTNSTTVTSTGGLTTSTGTLSSSTTMGTNSATTNSSTSGQESTSALQSLTSLVNTGGTERIISSVFSADQFSIVLSALQTQNETRLVSNPTVVTLNNAQASINIGEEFPIPSYTYNNERGTFEVSGFQYRPIGIILRVTPQVNAQGFIKLTVEPEVSSRTGTTTFGGASGAEIPIIASRRSRTEVSLRDGYTMGIGGLIENSTTNGQTKVPVLGSIPGVGRLFRSDTKNETKRNLLIFITAKTVQPDGAPIEEVFDPRAIRDMRLRRDDLPGYRDGSDPFEPLPTPANTSTPARGRR